MREQELCYLFSRLETLREKAESVSAPILRDRVDHSRRLDQIGDVIERIDSTEREAAALLEFQNRHRRTIENIIRRFSGPSAWERRAVLRCRYLDDEKWEDVSAILYGFELDFSAKYDSYLRRTYRAHGAALKAFTETITQEEEIQLDRS